MDITSSISKKIFRDVYWETIWTINITIIIIGYQ